MLVHTNNPNNQQTDKILRSRSHGLELHRDLEASNKNQTFKPTEDISVETHIASSKELRVPQILWLKYVILLNIKTNTNTKQFKLQWCLLFELLNSNYIWEGGKKTPPDLIVFKSRNISRKLFEKFNSWPGMEMYTCHHSTLEAETGRLLKVSLVYKVSSRSAKAIVSQNTYTHKGRSCRKNFDWCWNFINSS